MAIIKLKPYILDYEVITNDGYEDSNGDYHEGNSKWDGNIKCDVVSSGGKASEIKFEDGSKKYYTYTIFMNNDVRDFSIGEKIRLTLYGGVQKVFTVKGFQRYQLQVKLWV